MSAGIIGAAREAVSLDRVAVVFTEIIARCGRQFVFLDPVSSAPYALEPDEVASPIGLLPPFLVAAEQLWVEASGHGFALEIIERPGTYLGYAVQRIGAGTFSAVMLALIEALTLIDFGGDEIVCNRLQQSRPVLEEERAAAWKALLASPAGLVLS